MGEELGERAESTAKRLRPLSLNLSPLGRGDWIAQVMTYVSSITAVAGLCRAGPPLSCAAGCGSGS